MVVCATLSAVVSKLGSSTWGKKDFRHLKTIEVLLFQGKNSHVRLYLDSFPFDSSAVIREADPLSKSLIFRRTVIQGDNKVILTKCGVRR